MKLESRYKHVYAFETFDGGIKIGISKSPNKRKRQIETASGRNIKREFISELTPNAKRIESLIFSKFQLHRSTGEWFTGLKFDDVKLHMKFYDYSDDLFIY